MSENEERFEKTVLVALGEFRREIDVTPFVAPIAAGGAGWSVDEASERYEDVLWRHPEIFYVNKVRSLKWTALPGGRLADVKIVKMPYAIGPEEYAPRRVELEAAVGEAMEKLEGAADDADRARRLHDFILARCQYDKRGLEGASSDYRTSYDALVRGRAVCEGYVMAYRLLLDRAGIESAVAVSEAMNHCWNVVKVGGEWLNVDVTRDDPTYGGRLGLRARLVAHRHFLVSDRRLAALGHSDWAVRGGR